MTHSTQHPARNVIFGIVVIGGGIAALVDNLQWFDISLAHTLWPLALVLGGLGRLVWPHRPGAGFTGFALVAVGALLLAQNLGFSHIAWHDAWPVLAIIGGLSVVLRNVQRGRLRR